MCALHHMPYPSQASESLFKNVRTSFVEKSCRKASLYVHITTYIYKRHHFMNKVCGKCCHFFVCLCFGFFFLGPATSHVLPRNSPWRDYDMAAWGWLKLVLETWFEYGTESRLLSDDWSIMSLSSSSSLQFSRSSSLLPGKPFMLELFPLPWIPLAWREGREGSYEEEVPFSPEKLQIKKKFNNYV